MTAVTDTPKYILNSQLLQNCGIYQTLCGPVMAGPVTACNKGLIYYFVTHSLWYFDNCILV